MIENARDIAKIAHDGQMRRWGKEPYFCHVQRVALKAALLPGMGDIDIAAAYLHDVIEDHAVRQGLVKEYSRLIIRECGDEVLQLVLELTNPSESLEFDNKSREEKRAADWEHIRHVSNRAKRLKLIDRWDNVRSLVDAPSRYVQKYIPESRVLLELLKNADLSMAEELRAEIEKIEAGAPERS
jgi:(p)ppGpp synthase/HD superfamily hydrolase